MSSFRSCSSLLVAILFAWAMPAAAYYKCTVVKAPDGTEKRVCEQTAERNPHMMTELEIAHLKAAREFEEQTARQNAKDLDGLNSGGVTELVDAAGAQKTLADKDRGGGATGAANSLPLPVSQQAVDTRAPASGAVGAPVTPAIPCAAAGHQKN